jgi:hypothetical protein
VAAAERTALPDCLADAGAAPVVFVELSPWFGHVTIRATITAIAITAPPTAIQKLTTLPF